MNTALPEQRPGTRAAIAEADEATLVKLLSGQAGRSGRTAKRKVKVLAKDFRLDEAGLLRIWVLCSDLRIPRERSIPWLLSLAGSSVSEIARETGSHRTSVNAIIRGEYKPPLSVWRALRRTLGFDPLSGAK